MFFFFFFCYSLFHNWKHITPHCSWLGIYISPVFILINLHILAMILFNPPKRFRSCFQSAVFTSVSMFGQNVTQEINIAIANTVRENDSEQSLAC